MTGSDIYIHGSDPAEQDRLGLMNGLINAGCLRELGLRGDERVLELGAGTGVFAAEMAAALANGGSVVAVERDERQHGELQRRAAENLEARRGDVYDPPLAGDEWGRFDVVHARFLLEHLTDPARAVEVMARAVRPGGRIVLVDDDHSLMRLHPDPGGMRELWQAYYEMFPSMGNDPYIGSRLVELLVAAGCEPVRATQIDYGGCAGQRTFAGLADNLARVVATGRDQLLAHTDWTAERVDQAIDAFTTWSKRPDATIWYALPCAIARRPG